MQENMSIAHQNNNGKNIATCDKIEGIFHILQHTGLNNFHIIIIFSRTQKFGILECEQNAFPMGVAMFTV